MKKLLAILFLGLALYGLWWCFFKDKSTPGEAKQEAVKVDHHSTQFNLSVSNAVSSYLDIKAALVDGDSLRGS